MRFQFMVASAADANAKKPMESASAQREAAAWLTAVKAIL